MHFGISSNLLLLNVTRIDVKIIQHLNHPIHKGYDSITKQYFSFLLVINYSQLYLGI